MGNNPTLDFERERDEVRIPHVVGNIRELLADRQKAKHYGYETDQSLILTAEQLAVYQKLEEL